MFSEKDMEDAIVRDPEHFLGETGLRLVDRQYRIGNYVFDLLFEDRHRGKLIVEIQKGTLDRSHTYKILDYYDEFRENHPDDFIDLMVVANVIPRERKKRLRFLGIEFREVPESEFGVQAVARDALPVAKTATAPPPTSAASPTTVLSNTAGIPVDILQAYTRFREIKECFRQYLDTHHPGTSFTMWWKTLSPKNIAGRKNWFVCWMPPEWQPQKGSGFGIHWELYSKKDRRTDTELIRLNVGVEKPFRAEFRNAFKRDVTTALESRKVDLPEGTQLWPAAGAKLFNLEWPISPDTCTELARVYDSMNDFNTITGEYIRVYLNKGAFLSDAQNS